MVGKMSGALQTKLKTLRDRHDGFTIIELLAVLVVIGILLALVATTYAGVQRNQRNQERQRDIQDLYQQLEAYYVENAKYPTLADMDSTGWLTGNMKTLNKESLRDPSSSSYQLVAQPAKDAYAYDVTAADGGACDNQARPCAHYTLTATLEDTTPKTYVKSSLN
jgi:prepilin-type N-terminal cleavage/methylation domain-containing protein